MKLFDHSVRASLKVRSPRASGQCGALGLEFSDFLSHSDFGIRVLSPAIYRLPQIARMPELLYLIDVYSLVFQVFHAIPEMTSPHGLPTNAVFGFTRDILNILRQKQPTHILCATDPSGPGERENLYP